MEYLQYSDKLKGYGTSFIVLNLIINGIPSIREDVKMMKNEIKEVLNLIINGIPSIHIFVDPLFKNKS